MHLRFSIVCNSGKPTDLVVLQEQQAGETIFLCWKMTLGSNLKEPCVIFITLNITFSELTFVEDHSREALFINLKEMFCF